MRRKTKDNDLKNTENAIQINIKEPAEIINNYIKIAKAYKTEKFKKLSKAEREANTAEHNEEKVEDADILKEEKELENAEFVILGKNGETLKVSKYIIASTIKNSFLAIDYLCKFYNLEYETIINSEEYYHEPISFQYLYERFKKYNTVSVQSLENQRKPETITESETEYLKKIYNQSTGLPFYIPDINAEKATQEDNESSASNSSFDETDTQETNYCHIALLTETGLNLFEKSILTGTIIGIKYNFSYLKEEIKYHGYLEHWEKINEKNCSKKSNKDDIIESVCLLSILIEKIINKGRTEKKRIDYILKNAETYLKETKIQPMKANDIENEVVLKKWKKAKMGEKAKSEDSEEKPKRKYTKSNKKVISKRLAKVKRITI